METYTLELGDMAKKIIKISNLYIFQDINRQIFLLLDEIRPLIVV